MIALLLALLLALAPAQGAPKPMATPRPRDPWVFRSVLDGRPRIVTIALSDEMWIAYDATTCGLYKAWKGGVTFEGAVYTAAHGPQPRSHGPLYTEGYVGTPDAESIWEVTYRKGPDVVRETTHATWAGYKVKDTTQVKLLWDVALPGGGSVRVEESPEYVRPMDRFDERQMEGAGLPPKVPGLIRVFHVVDPPKDVKLTVRLRTEGGIFKQSLGLERERFEDVGEGADARTLIHSNLSIGDGRPVNYLLMFWEPLPEGEEAR